MKYWIYKYDTCYEDWQALNALKEGRLKEEDYVLINDKEWEELYRIASKEGRRIINNPETNRPMLKPKQKIPESILLEREVESLKDYLSETDWIYFKCQEEGLDVNVKYAEVIEKRKKARARINEIESITGVTYGNFK